MKFNYESCENCFARTQHIVSRLVYGEIDPQDNPLVTVAIPTYKRPELLKEAIESVLTSAIPPYQWELLIVDNEPDNGKPNLTESLVRKLKNKRIRYYRNSENMLPADNFNRCFTLARGKWVCMLHDDDLLLYRTLRYLGDVLEKLPKISTKPLGAISAGYVPFRYDPGTQRVLDDITALNYYFACNMFDFTFFTPTQSNIWFTGHPGGCLPSNGTTFNLEAVKRVGGFNSSFGLCGGMALLYNLENQYAVYQTLTPLGFCRCGGNSMSEQDAGIKTYLSIINMQNYVAHKNRLTRLLSYFLKGCWACAIGLQIEQQHQFVFPGKNFCDDMANIKRFSQSWKFKLFKIIVNEPYSILNSWKTSRIRQKLMALR
ncbi:glycosyltransferase family 2 protein [Desulfovibrio falkowii]|uniref:glycosyltransferase family 2 protein n=1 Tax=Desulfovibrio falkowii TaxID=3136602 RepID=UPI0038B2BCA7